MGTVISRNIKVSNTSDNPLYVDFQQSGILINTYNEILSLAGLASADLVLYTVPVGKKLLLKRVDYSGGNISIYQVTINASVEAKKRLYFTEYNGEFVFEDYLLNAGDIIKLLVENKTNMTADFNGNLQGRLIDAWT